mmetsp:Transcript_46373/g.110435  ORF Transcript_46373/g.110435 Transcript_46373/m.110435 type:complete len:579 (-) Transcript_46373:144-1880(-)
MEEGARLQLPEDSSQWTLVREPSQPSQHEVYSNTLVETNGVNGHRINLLPPQQGPVVSPCASTQSSQGHGANGHGVATFLPSPSMKPNVGLAEIDPNAEPTASGSAQMTLREALGDPEDRLVDKKRPSIFSLLKPRLPAFCRSTQLHLRLVILLVGLWILVGLFALGSEVGENLGLIDAVYVMAQVLTTIGYGDLVDWRRGDGMKMFMSFYSLFGMVVVASVFAVLGKEIQASSQHLLMQRLLRVAEQEENPLWEAEELNFTRRAEACIHSNVEKVKKTCLYRFVERYQGVLTAAISVFIALLIGMLFYGAWESCTCGRYQQEVDGCEPDNCEATGGYLKTYLDSWYMACISLSTVGFGDFSPKSTLGRCFAVVWMVLGVIAVANFQLEVSKLLLKNDKLSRILDTDLEDILAKFDNNGDGRLDQHEFLVFALLEGGIVEKSTLDQIYGLFEKLDHDGSGKISREEIKTRFEHQREEEHDEVRNWRHNNSSTRASSRSSVFGSSGARGSMESRPPLSPCGPGGSPMVLSDGSARASTRGSRMHMYNSSLMPPQQPAVARVSSPAASGAVVGKKVLDKE